MRKRPDGPKAVAVFVEELAVNTCWLFNGAVARAEPSDIRITASVVVPRVGLRQRVQDERVADLVTTSTL